MNVQTKLHDNITAIRICLENDGKKLSSQQIEQVAKFSGWGMCKAVLYDQISWENASIEDKKLRPMITELYDLLQNELTGKEYKKVMESIKNAVLTSFYTPNVVCSTFYQVLKQYTDIKYLIEPSAGSGVFVTEADKVFDLKYVVCYEKDTLTAKVLGNILSGCRTEYNVINTGFENSDEKGDYDICITNPPYGAFAVYDPQMPKEVTTKIHNYFVAKGLSKVKEQGLMIMLITSAFLDTVTNKSTREYLFNRADFISLTVLPDNLFKESGGTEAPSHFLVVRKNSSKTELSAEEQLLCISENKEYYYQSVVSRNRYIDYNKDYITIGETKIGKNQYGKPSVEVHWDKPIHEIEEEFRTILQRDFAKRYNKPKALYEQMTEFRQEQREQNIKAIADEIPPWEELQDHIQIELDKLPDEIHEELYRDTTDGITDDYEEGTCISCGAEMQSVGEQCGDCLEEEGLPIEQLQHVANELDRIGKETGIIPEDWETGKIEQTESVKKELSKRDKSVLEEYYKIKKAYTNLQNGTDT